MIQSLPRFVPPGRKRLRGQSPRLEGRDFLVRAMQPRAGAMDNATTSYLGPDRRRRRVYVTRNHEYHCRDGVCIAVRDVRSGAFVRSSAVGKQVSAAVHMRAAGGIESIAKPDDASPGARMHFADTDEEARDVLTGPLTAIERPRPEVVVLYEKERR